MSEERQETMADFASELEASYKEYDERRARYSQVPEDSADSESWKELIRMKEENTVTKVKIKEAVKAGLIAFIGEVQGFIPASQISTTYVEKLDEWVGKSLEVVPITVDPENKKLVLSGKAVMKEREEQEKAKKLEACHVGDVVSGEVESIKPYGAFVKLESGLSGLLHISQISNQRIKHPGVVLEEGQTITVKVIGMQDGKISLSMKVLAESDDQPVVEEHFDYKEEAEATTGLGALLKGIKL